MRPKRVVEPSDYHPLVWLVESMGGEPKERTSRPGYATLRGRILAHHLDLALKSRCVTDDVADLVLGHVEIAADIATFRLHEIVALNPEPEAHETFDEATRAGINWTRAHDVAGFNSFVARLRDARFGRYAPKSKRGRPRRVSPSQILSVYEQFRAAVAPGITEMRDAYSSADLKSGMAMRDVFSERNLGDPHSIASLIAQAYDGDVRGLASAVHSSEWVRRLLGRPPSGIARELTRFAFGRPALSEATVKRALSRRQVKSHD